MAAWSQAERAKIRMYMGVSSLATQYNEDATFLDSRLTTLEADVYAQDQILIKAKLNQLDEIYDEIHSNRFNAPVLSADRGEAELHPLAGDALLRNIGRGHVRAMSTIIGCPPCVDIFNPSARWP